MINAATTMAMHLTHAGDANGISETSSMPSTITNSGNLNMPFVQCLLDNLPEGVIFLDSNCNICNWNHGAEKLTGLGFAVIGRRFEPSIVQLKDSNRIPIPDSRNPFETWIRGGQTIADKFFITGRSGRDAQIDLQFFPVNDVAGSPFGGVLIMRDTSLQVELQKQLNDLYAIATLDPLTQVANRAEFERILEEYVQTHRAVGLTCSILVCDIDYFKKINDNYGHHIGDQALIAFASLLKQHVRPHDFVARFGGEEFIVLCAHCNEEAAQERAETVRRVLEKTPQPMLDNRTLNASFGVAELTEEDDATSLFVRADQALLRAKETGRNRTIRASSLKSKSNPTNERKATDSVCPDEWRKLSYNPLLVSEFCSGDILQMFIKKVQTMAEELSGQITNVTENSLTISLSAVSETKPHQKAQLIVDIDVVSPEKSPFIHSFPPHTKLLVRVAMIAKKGLFQPRDATPVAKTLMKQIRAALSFGHDSELFVSKLKEADKERYG